MRLSKFFILLAATACVSTAAIGQMLPRYDLQIGDQLVFEQRTRAAGADTPDTTRIAQLQVWVMRREGQEWKLFVDYTPVIDGAPGAARGGFMYLGERGHPRLDPETFTDLLTFDELLRMFVSFPTSWEDQTNWTTDPDWLGRRLRCEAEPASPTASNQRVIQFHMEDPTGVLEALGQEHSGTIAFDEKLGAPNTFQLVERAANGRVTETVVRFRRLLRHGESFAMRLEREAEAWLRASRRYERLADEFVRGVDEVEIGERRLRRCWPEYLQQASRASPLQPLGQGRQMEIEARVATLKRHRELITRWLGRVAPQWTAPDLNGESFQSESLPTDRPIIEMFWTRQAPESMAAFAGLSQMTRSPTGDAGPTVVCVNIDADVMAGRAACRALPGEMARVFTGAPIGRLETEDFPVFRVLTGDRRVKRLVFGLPANLSQLLEDGAP